MALGVLSVTTEGAEAHRAHLWTGVRVVSCFRRPPGGATNFSIDRHVMTFLPYNRLWLLYTFVSSESESVQPQVGRRKQSICRSPGPNPFGLEILFLALLIYMSLHMNWGVIPSLPSLCSVCPVFTPFGLADLVDSLLLGNFCRDTLNSFLEYHYK